MSVFRKLHNCCRRRRFVSGQHHRQSEPFNLRIVCLLFSSMFSLDCKTYLYSLFLSAVLLTVRLAGCCAIVGTEARLHLPASDLQLVGVRQVGAAHVAHPLLLTSSTLSHVDGHPGGPGGVPLYLWTRLQVTGLVLLNEKVAEEILISSFKFYGNF